MAMLTESPGSQGGPATPIVGADGCYLRPMTYTKKIRLGVHGTPALARGPLRASIPPRDARDDDLPDALVLLWSAERLIGGRAVVSPDAPEFDWYGLPMAMVRDGACGGAQR